MRPALLYVIQTVHHAKTLLQDLPSKIQVGKRIANLCQRRILPIDVKQLLKNVLLRVKLAVLVSILRADSSLAEIKRRELVPGLGARINQKDSRNKVRSKCPITCDVC